jgi:uncharacterized protein DUF2510
MRYMKPIGTATFLAGGLAAAISPFLHYAGDVSIWQSTTRYPLILTILVVVAMVLAVVSLAVDQWLPLVLSGLISAFVLGEVFPLIYPSYHLQVGFWLLTAGASLMTASSVLALAGSISTLRRAERRAGIAYAAGVVTRSSAAEETPSAAAQRSPALPPTGWYADPAGGAQERFWTGEVWTEQIRS